jgi:hypothetical protein
MTRSTLPKLRHDLRLLPPAYVKPYVKLGKTDANAARPSDRLTMSPPCAGALLVDPDDSAVDHGIFKIAVAE